MLGWDRCCVAAALCFSDPWWVVISVRPPCSMEKSDLQNVQVAHPSSYSPFLLLLLLLLFCLLRLTSRCNRYYCPAVSGRTNPTNREKFVRIVAPGDFRDSPGKIGRVGKSGPEPKDTCPNDRSRKMLTQWTHSFARTGVYLLITLSHSPGAQGQAGALEKPPHQPWHTTR